MEIPQCVQGLPLIPVDAKTKSPSVGGDGWATKTYTVEGLQAILDSHPTWGIGVLLGDYIDVEVDAPDDVRALAAEDFLKPLVTPTLTWQSARGLHRLYRLTPEQRAALTRSVVKHDDIEFRLGGPGKALQSVLPPTAGRTLAQAQEPSILPDALFQFICLQISDKRDTPAREESRDGDVLAAEFSWDDILTPLGWKRFRDLGDVVQWTRPGKSEGISATTGFCEVSRADDVFYAFSTADEVSPLPSQEAVTKFEAIAFTRHGNNFGAALDYLRDGVLEPADRFATVPDDEWDEAEEPDAPVSDKPPYELDRKDMDNILGRFANYLSDEGFTDASPDSIYLSLLTLVGNFLGPAVTTSEIGGHSTRLFTILVGPPGIGRKGTAGREATRVAVAGGPTSDLNQWNEKNLIGSVSSGEGVIGWLSQHQDDARMMLWLEEADRMFSVMTREGNTLSAVIREGYDGRPLNVLTKRDPLYAQHNHLGILAMTTNDEYRKAASHANEQSGLLSRFLTWGSLRRRVIPMPRASAEADERRRELAEELDEAKSRNTEARDYRFSDDAREWWCEFVAEMDSGATGFDVADKRAAQTARSGNHVIRVALILAALDKESGGLIQVIHLEQARGVLRGHLATTNYFTVEGDRDIKATLLQQVLDSGARGVTRTELYKSARSIDRTIRSSDVDQLVEDLRVTNRITAVKTKAPKAARPTIIYLPA